MSLGPPKRKLRPVDPRLEIYEKRSAAVTELEYKQDTIAQLKCLEDKLNIDAAMIDLQPELDWSMRPLLFDFLVDSHLSLRLGPDTLSLAVSILDRYCSMRVVFKKHYQLVGCASLWIAAKFDDKKTRTPTIAELKSMCCNAYEEDMFVQMESHILNTLGWSLDRPTCYSFLSLSLGADLDRPVGHIAQFLAENCLFHRVFLTFKPSIVATACHVLALYILNHYPAVPDSVTPAERQCIELMMQLVCQSPSKSVAAKYSRQSTSQAVYLVQSFYLRQQQQKQEQKHLITQYPHPPQHCHNTQSLALKTPSSPMDIPGTTIAFSTPSPISRTTTPPTLSSLSIATASPFTPQSVYAMSIKPSGSLHKQGYPTPPGTPSY